MRRRRDIARKFRGRELRFMRILRKWHRRMVTISRRFTRWLKYQSSLTVRHSHCVTSPLEFAVVERPAPGSILVLTHWAGSVELLHVAADRTAAEYWLQSNRHTDAVLEEVPDETPPSQFDLGRVA